MSPLWRKKPHRWGQHPEHVREIKRVIETHLPRIRIEDLLVEIDRWCGFTREFVPLPGYQLRTERSYTALLAALVAHLIEAALQEYREIGRIT